MALCGWASIDENGKGRGGKAGDQKQTSKKGVNDYKGEVKVGEWYNFGQTFVIRYKSETKAKKHAKALKSLCNNPHVGYDMNQRTTLNTQLTKIGWDNYDKLAVDCETDCSDLQDVCAKIAGAIDTTIATAGMKNVYSADSDFIILTDKKYLTSGDYLLAGDISVAPGHHTIGCIADGAKSANESRGNTSSGGYVTTANLNLRASAGNGRIIVVIPKGTSVKVNNSKSIEYKGDTWLYIDYDGKKGYANANYIHKK